MNENQNAIIENEEALEHHGVDGMHWGRRNGPPYPLNSIGKAALSRQKKKDAKLAEKQEERESKRAKKRVKVEAKEEKKEQKTQEEIDSKKEEVLKSRSAKQLYDNADLFDYKELQDAYNRLNLEKSIKSLSPQEISKGDEYIKKLKKAGDALEATVKVTTSTINLYNNIAKVYNTYDKDANLPIIKNKDKDDKK